MSRSNSPANTFNPGHIRANTSPSVAPCNSCGTGFLLAWVDPTGLLTIDDGNPRDGIQQISHATPDGGATLVDAHVKPGTSPVVAGNGTTARIMWQDVSGHLEECGPPSRRCSSPRH